MWIQIFLIRYESDVTEEELLAKVRELNNDDDVDGFIKCSAVTETYLRTRKSSKRRTIVKDVDASTSSMWDVCSIGLPLRYPPPRTAKSSNC